MTDNIARLTAALADRYRIERELGAGGMATVYLARDVRHDRNVALKVLRPELAAVLGADRFLKEIRLTANLQHPHILPLHDSGEVDGNVFYVMPFVAGESLRDLLNREKQLPVDTAVRIAREVLSALDYAHRHGVVHRDIKPENILLHDGQALVADFGIALAVSTAGAGTRMTETGMSLGTPHYMSPEQAMGEREITPKSDVYALGCVLYEMLLGEPPFSGPTAQAIIARVITEEPRSMTMQRKTIPPHVEAAVRVALQKLPADRFASAAGFADALANPAYSSARTAAVGTTTARVDMGAATARLTGGARPLAILVVACVLSALGGFWLARPGRAPDLRAIQFTVDAKLGEAATGSHIGMAADGTQLVYVGLNELGRSQLFVRTLGELTPVAIAGTEGSIVKDPVLSPDGSTAAYYADQQLRTVSMRGGTVRALAKMSPLSGGLSWNGNDALVFQPEYGSGLKTVGASGGVLKDVTRPDSAAGEMDHRWPFVLPDGKSVLLTIWRGNTATASIGVASLSTGKVRELLPGMYPRYANGFLVFATAAGELQAVPLDAASGRTRGTTESLVDSIASQTNGLAEYTLSLDGTLAYVVRAGNRTPVVANLAGSMTELGLPPGGYSSPRIAPDGSSLAMGYNGEIWIYDLKLGTFGALTSGGGFYPVWTRDSKRMLYARDAERDVHVYSVAVDRASESATVLEARGQYRTQDISPDSRHLLLRANNVPVAGNAPSAAPVTSRPATGQYDIWLLTLDSASSGRPWLATQFLERSPTFSPDGRWVAYSSDESGHDEVYVKAFPGPGGRTPVSTGGGSEPAWTRDGSRLIYRAADRFEAVSVQLGSTFRVLSRPQTLFRGKYYAYPWQRQYDVFPDGRRLLLLRSEEEISGVRVLMNSLGARQRGENR